MSATVGEIVTILKDMAPLQLKESWDNPGLLVGNPDESVTKIMVTLDVMMEGVDYAIEHGVDLIVSHHPVIFDGLKSIRTDMYDGAMFQKLLAHHISVFSAHTNLDSANGGVNDVLAHQLGLTDLLGLVPVEAYPDYAMGRVGSWPTPEPAGQVLHKIKELLHVPVLPYAGNPDTMVTKVAVLGGAGASFMDIAKASGAQLYVTGDVKYHDAQQAVKLGLVVADGGHFGTEIFVVADLQKRLSHVSETTGWNIRVITDPTSHNMLNYFTNESKREQK